MALAFPSSPTTNQVYTYNGVSWTWSGIAWVLVAASSTAVNTVAGRAGAVTLSTSDVSEGTNLYFTSARVLALIQASSVNSSAGIVFNNLSLFNTFAGYSAGLNTTIGNYNVGYGYNALTTNTTGYGNTAIGSNSLAANTVGISNTAVGYNALLVNTTGIANTAVGINALAANTTGSYNTANGAYSLQSNTTGAYNTAVGWQALTSNINGLYNTAVGYRALFTNSTAVYNTAVGYSALYFNTTGSYNTAIGCVALQSNTTGVSNTAIGYAALQSNTTGQNNTAIGYIALQSNSTGTDNTIIGYNSGTQITSSYNVIIGSGAQGSGTLAGQTNNIVIGFSAATSSNTVSNEATIGNGSLTAFRIPGINNFRIDTTSGPQFGKTNAGSTGAQTINLPSGSVQFAASATSLVVTNSMVSASSLVFATVASNDSTMKSVQAVSGSGIFTLYPNAVPTGTCLVNFWVIN